MDLIGAWKARILSLWRDGQLTARRRVNRTGSLACIDNGTDMSKHPQPSKESVRQCLRARLETRRPPPDPQQIRRELGWDLVRIARDPKR
jgi:hypothetical protein